MYPNQRIQGPFGDIYGVSTPYLDKVSDRLYAEQKQREAQQAKEAMALDKEFASNMAGIRDADIPDLVKAYGDWKNSSIALMKKGNITPQEQMELLRKKGAVYGIINPSKSFKQREDLENKGIISKRYNYTPTASGDLVQIRRTPLSKMDISSDPLGSLLYKGSTYKYGADDIKKSLGLKRTIFGEYKPIDASGLQTEAEKYESFSNTPEQVKQYYKGKMADPEANWHYTNELMNLPENELQKTNDAFNAIPDEHWKRLGIEKPKLEYGQTDDNAEVLSTYKAQKAALENIPQFVGVDRKTNLKAKKEYEYQDWLKKNGITFGQRKELAQQQHEYQKAMKYGYDNQWLDQNWENLKANPTGTLVVTRADGNKEEFKVLGVSNVYKKFFESQGYEPDDVIIDPKGNVSGVIYQRDEKDGKIIKSEATGNRPIVQSVVPVKMSEKQAKIYYGKSISSGKDLTGEIGTPDEQQVLSESTKEKTKSLAQRMKEAKMKK